MYQFSSVQLLSRDQLCDPMTTARQASLSITNTQNLLELMPVELVMPSNHLILCHPLLFSPSIFPTSGSFQMSQLFASGGQSILVMFNSLLPHGLYSLWNSPGQNSGIHSHSLLQGIFPTQESNWGLLNCRWILY